MSTEGPSSNTGTLFVASQCVVSTGSIVWDIEHLFQFNLTTGKSHTSPEFKAGDTRWKLNCFPAGEFDKDGRTINYLGLYLHSLNEKTLQCKYSITLIIGEDKIEDIHISNSDEFGGNDNWGWGQLCPIELLQQLMQEKGSTTLRIKCEVEVFVKRHNVSAPVRNNPDSAASSSVSQDYEKLLANAPFSDVIFDCEDKQIPAHKSILSIRSPVFHTMFASGMKEANNGIVKIGDCSAHLFQDVLAQDVQEIMALSDRYDIADLKQQCSKILLQQLSTQNAASILLLADTHHSTKLKEEVLHFSVQNFEAVIMSNDFIELCNGSPALVAELNLARANLLKEIVSRPTKKKKIA